MNVFPSKTQFCKCGESAETHPKLYPSRVQKYLSQMPDDPAAKSHLLLMSTVLTRHVFIAILKCTFLSEKQYQYPKANRTLEY